MPRYKLIVGWKGTNYRGWQKAGGGKDDQSIHTHLERVTRLFTKDPQSLSGYLRGTSRTDRGVHAIGAVAQVDFDNELPEDTLKKAINYHLQKNDEKIWIVSAEKVGPDWYCREHKSKTYIYRVACNSNRALGFMEEDTVWHVRREVNEEAMHKACSMLEGVHDFSGFTTSLDQNPKRVKEIFHFNFDRVESPWIARPYPNVQYYQFTTEGDAFLYRQVRKMVGAAVAMGLGRINETDIQRVLHDGDGSIIPLLAPAHGLYLGSVNYEREDGTTRKE